MGDDMVARREGAATKEQLVQLIEASSCVMWYGSLLDNAANTEILDTLAGVTSTGAFSLIMGQKLVDFVRDIEREAEISHLCFAEAGAVSLFATGVLQGVQFVCDKDEASALVEQMAEADRLAREARIAARKLAEEEEEEEEDEDDSDEE